MDRLTIKSPDKDADEYIVPALTNGEYTCTCEALCKDMHFDGNRAYCEKCDIQRAFTLLAAYENTGLTPEEITAMKADYEQRQKICKENEKLSKAEMNKQILEQIYYINRELKMWEHELERLKMRSPVTSPTPRTGSGNNISDPTARIAERRIEIESYVKFKAEQLQAARDEAMKLIWEIPDSLTRMIVFYRCVSLMSWRRVAYEVGGGNSETGVRQIYSRFMKDLSHLSQTDVV